MKHVGAVGQTRNQPVAHDLEELVGVAVADA
jgi:hypothetical protein